MTKTLMILAASTALTVALGLPAWSAMHGPAQTAAAAPLTRLLDAGERAARLILADDDGDDDEGGNHDARSTDESEDGCDDEDGGCSASAPPPAPAGAVPPPQNGLFDNGAAPQVQVK